MTPLAPGLDYFDLRFGGHAGFIATGLLHGASGVGLVDPGPTTCLPVLRAALATRGFTTADVRWILLTHIHLDHAAATGALLRECPAARVLVHERGVKHLVDPSRLIASATQLYGDDMDRLWGEIAPVPSANIDAIGDYAETVVAGHEVKVAWTPGHANHHVSYWLPGPRVAFVGDVAGLSRPGGQLVLPLTAPPETDLDALRQSTETVLSWNPDVLFLAHFGPQWSPRVHFQQMWKRMDDWSNTVRAAIAAEGTDEDRSARFASSIADEFARVMPRAEADAYALAARLDISWAGLARYWRKKDGMR